jgi:hypothetical protein
LNLLHYKVHRIFYMVALQGFDDEAPAAGGDAEGPVEERAEVAQQGGPLHFLRWRTIHVVVDNQDDDSVESFPLAPQAMVAVPSKVS